jgi:hypothetical protein
MQSSLKLEHIFIVYFGLCLIPGQDASPFSKSWLKAKATVIQIIAFLARADYLRLSLDCDAFANRALI